MYDVFLFKIQYLFYSKYNVCFIHFKMCIDTFYDVFSLSQNVLFMNKKSIKEWIFYTLFDVQKAMDNYQFW